MEFFGPLAIMIGVSIFALCVFGAIGSWMSLIRISEQTVLTWIMRGLMFLILPISWDFYSKSFTTDAQRNLYLNEVFSFILLFFAVSAFLCHVFDKIREDSGMKSFVKWFAAVNAGFVSIIGLFVLSSKGQMQ
jgi:hypothetical protein